MPQFAPKSPQNRARMPPKCPNLHPKRPKTEPGWAQMPPKCPNLHPNSPKAASMPIDCPKVSQSSLIFTQSAPKLHQDAPSCCEVPQRGLFCAPKRPNLYTKCPKTEPMWPGIPIMCPKVPQNAHISTQNCLHLPPKMPLFASKNALISPKNAFICSQNAPKLPHNGPGCPQTALKYPKMA